MLSKQDSGFCIDNNFNAKKISSFTLLFIHHSLHGAISTDWIVNVDNINNNNKMKTVYPAICLSSIQCNALLRRIFSFDGCIWKTRNEMSIQRNTWWLTVRELGNEHRNDSWYHAKHSNSIKEESCYMIK